MSPAEIIGIIITALGLLAGLSAWAFKLHGRQGVLAAKHAEQARMSHDRHTEHDRRIVLLEQSNATNQTNICEISKGVAVLLERTKHMGDE